MKNMMFGIEMFAVYGIILGFAFYELWKVSRLTKKDDTKSGSGEDDGSAD